MLAEKLKFDSFWVTDHFVDVGGTKLDPWSVIGGLSTATTRIFMGSYVTDTQRSHPARTAHVVATLAQISDNRVGLGIGAGEAMNLIPFGLPFDAPGKRTKRLSEAVQVIKLLWSATREHPVCFKGEHFILDGAWLDIEIENPPPIYVGSLGGRGTLDIVGRLGDGYLPWVNSHSTFQARVKRIKEAASAAGRKATDIDFVANVYVALSDNEEIFRRSVSSVKRSLLMERNTLKELGFVFPPGLESYQEFLVKGNILGELAKFEKLIPDETALEFMAHGSSSQIIDRLEAFKKAGATHIVFDTTADRGEENVRDFAKKILPYYLEPHL
jgi:alkanesulfonate monooxygenase SsuD/methylene tetrahydromethanopterin reductase-like flavin-dependent oxidoreductase (luciferase family)